MITLPDGLGGPAEIKKRFTTAQTRRDLWRPILKEMYEYCIPNRETFNFNTPGDRKARHLFDSTGPESLITFVSVLFASSTPDDSQWMTYAAGSEIPANQVKDTNKALEDATKVFFDELSLSDFQSQVNISHQDMAISTGALMIEEGNGITEPLLLFTAIPLPELFLEPTSMAKVHTFFRSHKIKAQELEMKFPGAHISDKLRSAIDKGGSGDIDIIDGNQVFNFKDKTYHQIVMWEDEIIFHQSYGDSPPGIIYRWGKVSNETYGRGPADMAMSDIRTTNKVKEFALKAAALKLAPPIVGVSDGIFNPHTAVIHPGTVMAASSVDSVKVLDVGGDMRTAQFTLEDLQQNIRRIFFADPLGQVDDPVKSATEQAIRNKDMIQKRGANFGRLRSEFIVPLVTRCTEILRRNGKIGDIRVDGREVKLVMKSPLGNSEKNQNVDNVLLYMNALQGMPPEVSALAANLEGIPEFLVQNLQLPEELARDKEQIKKIKADIQEQMQAQQEQQQGGPPLVQ